MSQRFPAAARTTVTAMLLWNSASRVETFCGIQTRMTWCFTPHKVPGNFNCLDQTHGYSSRFPHSPMIHALKASLRRRTIRFQSFESYGIQNPDPNIPSSKYEILLAELAFSNPLEFPKIVESNLELLDEPFYKCMLLNKCFGPFRV